MSKQETRDALVAAGLTEFASRGLDVPSLDAICARAGFTRGAFYVHFRDRDEFLEAVMEKVFLAFLDAIIATGDAAQDLLHTIDRFAATLAGSDAGTGAKVIPMEIHRVLDACARSPKLRHRFVALLRGGADRVSAAVESGQRAGSVRADLPPAVLGELLAVLALGIVTAVDTAVPLEFERLRLAVLRLLSPRPC